MNTRIAIWAGVGALVALFWSLYISSTFPTPLFTNHPGVAAGLAYLTCPISLAHQYAIGFYSVIIVNSATYALLGMIAETIRRQNQTRLIPN